MEAREECLNCPPMLNFFLVPMKAMLDIESVLIVIMQSLVGAAPTRIGGTQFSRPLPPQKHFRFPATDPRRAATTNLARAQSVAASSMHHVKTLISFDVDGTLIHSVGQDSNKLHKEAFSAAFREVFDLETNIDVVPHHGSTDPLILVKVLEFHGVDHDRAMARLPEMQQAMVDHFMEHKERAATGLEILPGVVELLTALKQRDDVCCCLVTGNLQPIGWAKMQALGIKDLFTPPYYGGFGSDFCSGNNEGMGWRDRAELVRIAAKRCAEHSGGAEVGLRFHIGDAPMDVQAAESAGAHPIGVTTGIYTEEQLKTACPSATLLEGLHDIDAVMKILKLL